MRLPSNREISKQKCFTIKAFSTKQVLNVSKKPSVASRNSFLTQYSRLETLDTLTPSEFNSFWQAVSLSVGTLFEDDGFGDLLPVNVRLRSDQRLQSDHHCREKTHTHTQLLHICAQQNRTEQANTLSMTVQTIPGQISWQLSQREKKKKESLTEHTQHC